MRARLLLAGDLHKRPKDISTISGYCNAVARVQTDIINAITKYNITHFVSLGDWYDKGYVADVASALVDVDKDIHMADILNGNFYGCIGNHIKLNLDSNPELHLIQPHETMKSRKMYREEQIIRTPRHFMLTEDVQVSLMHFNTGFDVKDYKPRRLDGVKYHIAVFHTPLIIPREQLGVGASFMSGATSSRAIEETTRGVDLAIVGDIHTPIPTFTINHSDGTKTTMIVPGSLCNNNSSKIHHMINAPMVTVDDEGVKLEFLPISMHTELTTINKKKELEDKEKLQSFRGKASSVLQSGKNKDLYIPSDSLSSYGDFLRGQARGSSLDVKLINTVVANPDNINNIIKIYLENEGE